MNGHELARGYLRKCEDSLAAMDVLVAREAWSNVVRESQQVVELALKGILRVAGIDPPKWHDVGPLLVEHRGRFPGLRPEEIDYLAEASRVLRKEREFALYGDIDFVPTEQYDREAGMSAAEQASAATEALRRTLGEGR